MTYRTILVHLNDERRVERVLRPALALARTQGAEVLGLHVMPGVAALTSMVVPYGAEIAGSIVEGDRKVGKAIESAFRRLTAGEPISTRWLEVETMQADLCAVVIDHVRAVDLVVAAQADPLWSLSDLVDFPERLAMESGRPVLVIPNTAGTDTLGRRALIAWNGGREASRAVFDALPLLAAAQSVHVLSVEDGADAGVDVDALVASLSRHGIEARAERMAAEGRDVADVLLTRAGEVGADLLVMGAYGHSRWREYVFGGVTRVIARRMTIPTLLSH